MGVSYIPEIAFNEIQHVTNYNQYIYMRVNNGKKITIYHTLPRYVARRTGDADRDDLSLFTKLSGL